MQCLICYGIQFQRTGQSSSPCATYVRVRVHHITSLTLCASRFVSPHLEPRSSHLQGPSFSTPLPPARAGSLEVETRSYCNSRDTCRHEQRRDTFPGCVACVVSGLSGQRSRNVSGSRTRFEVTHGAAVIASPALSPAAGWKPTLVVPLPGDTLSSHHVTVPLPRA